MRRRTSTRPRDTRAPALRLAGLVIAGAVVAVLAVTWAGRSSEAGSEVVVSSGDGDVLARVVIPGDRFAVGYRNSIYGSRAEERYRVTQEGRFALEELAADQLAVLEEYYAVPGAPRPAPPGDRREFVAEPHPDRAPSFDELSVAATDLGERTLFVPGSPPVPLWQLVDAEEPTVVLHLQGVP